jgi:sulfate permease, SulP family
LKKLLSGWTPNNFFSGFIVAVVALPLCIAFAIASGLNPMAGVISGVVGGLIAGAFGSSRFQVSGPAAAFITIIYGIVGQHGLPVLLAATFVAGLIVLGIALLRLGKVMELMPHSVIVGFTSGIGVLILLGQIPAALGIQAEGKDALTKLAFTAAHFAEGNPYELAVIVGTVVTALFWRKTPLARWIPAPLVALATGTGLSLALADLGQPVRTIGTLYDISLKSLALDANFLAGIPAHWNIVLASGLTLGILIAVESLLSAKALDSMTGSRHDPDRELIGLGLANLVVPFLGGLPASGVIVRGSTNVMSGATSRTSAILHAVFLTAFVALLYEYIQRLPMAALAGVLLLTAMRLIEVHELRTIARIESWEGALALLTLVLTVTLDLTVSVPLGVGLMLILAVQRMLSERRIDVRDQHGQVVLAVNDSVTFLTSPGLRREIERHLNDERVRAINLASAHFIDSTGAMMVGEVMRRYPHLQVWVADRAGADKMEHAGIEVERISLMGNRVVNLPRVFERLHLKAA